MNQVQQNEKHAKWLAIIDSQEKSGLSQTEYCKQNNIKISTFTYYRGVVKGKSSNEIETKPGFKPVKVVPNENNDIKLALPNGFQLALPINMDASRVKQLVEALLSC